ncbi:MAG: BMP family ABC transporter substrate-binding protein [Erysipelotrichaceae bacterium]|nr:BMP family ABC transporter substrate-binding protein [Erysipelotrichaceae bacterium]MBQ1300277.1 BMP family ABC transporter substrate-binding protein [Erysipelotrichaceae bacterium]MBQ1303374.1 BMP family ABC transporter substrate-binding protein [Erysipelotrichaceae bacterium]MBQ1757830.1 BMP family ABC transporter substrate-binding protein [Erysipelotrichaceae bacterium]MBQ2214068.1 BMP family ABC transporter substrate-binding protein [Erysipelotrichaceae bacterium]
MKKIIALFLALTMVLGLAACGQKEPEEEPTNKYADYKVAMVSNTVGTDQFILQAKNQLDALAKEYGFTESIIECITTDDWEQKTRTACEQGYNLIVGVGWNSAAPFSTLQEEFPDVQFGVIDTIAANEKIMSMNFNTTDGCYVMGAMIATAFPNDTVFGYIGNFQQQSNFEYKYGFMEGVKSVKPDAKFVSAYADTYGDTSATYNKAVEVAAALGSNGHFIMGSVANSANAGIYQYALDRVADGAEPIYTSGLSVDQTTPENPYIISGLTKNTAIPMKMIVEDFLDDGKVTGGATTLGVTQDAFCVVGVNFDANYRNTDIMTDEVLAAGHKAADDLKSGKVVLPYVMEDDYKE